MLRSIDSASPTPRVGGQVGVELGFPAQPEASPAEATRRFRQVQAELGVDVEARMRACAARKAVLNRGLNGQWRWPGSDARRRFPL